MSPNTPPTPGAAPPTVVQWADPQRHADFDAWLSGLQARFSLQSASLRPASSDASFRRYLRIDTLGGSYGESLVIMDAPPEKENCAPFVQVAQLLHDAQLRAPQVLDWQKAHGFMLITDLGARTMMQVIDTAAAPPLDLYLQAVDTLITWQKASRPGVLPLYDHALLRREMELFPQWYIAQHRQVILDADQRKVLDAAFETIITENLAWPNVYVHRDFMPRNLMAPTLVAARTALPPEGALASLGRPGAGDVAPTLVAARTAPPPEGALVSKLGVLDFQDAVYGPITYDIASLMRDAFLSWDEDFCLDVTVRYWQKARQAGLPVGDDFGVFYRGVEWMGLQRHLKVAGIFARLTLRDGKPQYLADTPRFITYIRATCARYRELKPLLRLIDKIEGIEEPNVFGFGRSPGAA
jgi:aminoglycoside/choline kinase family phosphotransferase